MYTILYMFVQLCVFKKMLSLVDRAYKWSERIARAGGPGAAQQPAGPRWQEVAACPLETAGPHTRQQQPLGY